MPSMASVMLGLFPNMVEPPRPGVITPFDLWVPN
jgi:hypothetical protein